MTAKGILECIINTWLTADYHLGEIRFEIMGRPFLSQEEMVDRLIHYHNLLVAPDDKVIVVGDVCYQNTPEFLQYVSKFKGIKTLIRGNHDRGIPDSEFKKYFSEIVPEGEGIDLEVEEIPCYATHYPTQGKLDRFNLCGHVHAAWKYQLNMLNVGVDVHHFRPVNLNTIPFHYKAICEFYDNDVWIGYNEINSAYKAVRGKKGSYFHD